MRKGGQLTSDPHPVDCAHPELPPHVHVVKLREKSQGQVVEGLQTPMQ